MLVFFCKYISGVTGYPHALVNLCFGKKVVISSTLHVAFIICKVLFLFLIE